MDLVRQAIESPKTEARFIQIFQGIHRVDANRAQGMFQTERFNFMRQLQERNIPGNITELSARGVFLEVVSNGMNFSEQSKHVYLMSRKVNIAPKGKPKQYEMRLVYSTQPDGKIFICQRAGSIKDVTKPVMVYEGDDWDQELAPDGKQILVHKRKKPRGTKIIAGYIFIIHPDGYREPFWMEIEDIERLKGYSSRNNAQWDDDAKKMVPGPANALYTSNGGQIDPGFFGAKLINFGLKNKRKARYVNEHEVDDDDAYTPDIYIPPSHQLTDDAPAYTADTEPDTTDAEPVTTPPGAKAVKATAKAKPATATQQPNTQTINTQQDADDDGPF